MRRHLLLGAAVAAAVGLATAGWLTWNLTRSGPDAVTTVEVPEGASVRDAVAVAHRAGLLPSPLVARLYLEAAGRGRTVHWGRYTFPAGARPVDVLEQLLNGAVDLVTVTVLEGLTLEQVGASFAAAGIGSPDAWRGLGDRTAWVADLAPDATSLEGFLFPDTYRFAVGTRPERAARHLVARFREVWSELTAPSGGSASVLEVVTLASLVEAETHLAAERPVVAGVFRNRLRRGMLLQCDPTVVFALQQTGAWTGRLRRDDLSIDHPYNTYRYPGLPPGPINSPGRAALAAALAPAATDALYFVARPGGGHTFSRTLSEHNRAVAALRRATR